MTATSEDLVIVDNEAEGQFETHVQGKTAVLKYTRADGRATYSSTQVPKELEGHGIGGKLANYALQDARTRGLKVVPSCPFVAAYIERNPEFADLVDSGNGPAGAHRNDV